MWKLIREHNFDRDIIQRHILKAHVLKVASRLAIQRLIFLWVTGIPCYIALVLGWKIASNIGRDQSFSNDNAKYLKWIAWLAASDGIFFFVGNIVLLFTNMSHPGIVLFSLIVVFAGVAVAVASATFSHLVQKAEVLQEQSNLTI